MARNETTEGFVVFELPAPPIVTSAKEFAERYGVDYPTAQGFIKFLVKRGIAKQVKSRKIDGQRGKPTNIYELPIDIAVKLAA